MSANVETMFYVREKPWHGLGTEVKEAPASADALVYAGLDWNVIQGNADLIPRNDKRCDKIREKRRGV